MAAPDKKNNNVSSIAASTGGSIQRGNTETKKIEVKDKTNRVQAQPDAAPPAPAPVSEVAPTVSDLTRQIEKLTAEQPDVGTEEDVYTFKLGDMENGDPATEQEITDTLNQLADVTDGSGSDLTKATAAQEEDEGLTEQEKKERGFAKASPNFEEVDKAKAAQASAEEKAASLEENKIDEVEVEGDSAPDA